MIFGVFLAVVSHICFFILYKHAVQSNQEIQLEFAHSKLLTVTITSTKNRQTESIPTSRNIEQRVITTNNVVILNTGIEKAVSHIEIISQKESRQPSLLLLQDLNSEGERIEKKQPFILQDILDNIPSYMESVICQRKWPLVIEL